MSLTEYANQQNQRAEFARGEKAWEYLGLMGDFPARMRSGLADLEKLAPSLGKFIEQKEREYPRNPNYPPALRHEVESLHVNYLKPGRDRLGTLAARIQAFLDKIARAKPEDFVRFSPKTLAPLDCERAGSLLSEVDFLRQLPEMIGRIETAINEFVERWKGREYTPDKAAIMSRAPDSGEEKQKAWDARLS